MNTPSVGHEALDWTNDEAVVRAAEPDLVVVTPADEGSSGIWASGIGGYLGDDWAEARQHPSVVHFEREHNPALSSKPAVGEVGEVPALDKIPHPKAYKASEVAQWATVYLTQDTDQHIRYLSGLLAASRAETERLKGELSVFTGNKRIATCFICGSSIWHREARIDNGGGWCHVLCSVACKLEAAELEVSRLKAESAQAEEAGIKKAAQILLDRVEAISRKHDDSSTTVDFITFWKKHVQEIEECRIAILSLIPAQTAQKVGE